MAKVTKRDYIQAKKIIENYKQNLREEISREQSNCNHESFYRHWYNEDHLMNVCRNCSYEWEEFYRPFLLKDYRDLTSGKFERTDQDLENWRKHKKRLENIDNL